MLHSYSNLSICIQICPSDCDLMPQSFSLFKFRNAQIKCPKTPLSLKVMSGLLACSAEELSEAMTRARAAQRELNSLTDTPQSLSSDCTTATAAACWAAETVLQGLPAALLQVPNSSQDAVGRLPDSFRGPKAAAAVFTPALACCSSIIKALAEIDAQAAASLLLGAAVSAPGSGHGSVDCLAQDPIHIHGAPFHMSLLAVAPPYMSRDSDPGQVGGHTIFSLFHPFLFHPSPLTSSRSSSPAHQSALLMHILMPSYPYQCCNLNPHNIHLINLKTSHTPTAPLLKSNSQPLHHITP
jgi:hypothetical protein